MTNITSTTLVQYLDDDQEEILQSAESIAESLPASAAQSSRRRGQSLSRLLPKRSRGRSLQPRRASKTASSGGKSNSNRRSPSPNQLYCNGLPRSEAIPSSTSLATINNHPVDGNEEQKAATSDDDIIIYQVSSTPNNISTKKLALETHLQRTTTPTTATSTNPQSQTINQTMQSSYKSLQTTEEEQSKYSILSAETYSSHKKKVLLDNECSVMKVIPEKDKSKKKKSVWMTMKNGFKKKKNKDGNKKSKMGSQPSTDDISKDYSSSPSRLTTADESNRSGNTNLTSPSLSGSINDSLRGDSQYNNGEGIQYNKHEEQEEDDSDVPWFPTMSMLLQTGQLDCIESDSDEDNYDKSSNLDNSSSREVTPERSGGSVVHEEENGNELLVTACNASQRSMEYQTQQQQKQQLVVVSGHEFENSDVRLFKRNSSYEVENVVIDNDIKAIAENEDRTADPDEFMMDSFCNRVATSYMTKRSLDGTDIIHCCDMESKADESTLSKEDTVYSTSVTQQQQNTTTRSNSRRKSRGKSRDMIRSLSASITRRGRSRGRVKKNEHNQMIRRRENGITIHENQVHESNEEPTSSSLSEQDKKKSTGSITASLSTADSNNNPTTAVKVSASRRGRSRSLFRNILPTRSSRGRGVSLDTRVHTQQVNETYGCQMIVTKKRDAQSLPRRSSTTNKPIIPKVSSLDCSNASSLAELSVLSSGLEERKAPKRKKCLVCRQKIPRGEGIQYMNNFYFCSNDCFQCSLCHKQLVENDDTTQIISNARGSIVQCDVCAKAIMGYPTSLIPQEARANDGADTQVSTLNEYSVQVDESQAEEDTVAVPRLSALTRETTAEALAKAAKRIAEKVSIKMSLSSDGDDDDDQQLSTLYFTQNEDEKHQSKRSLRANHSDKSNMEGEDSSADPCSKIKYELDADVFGNPNYDGYECSINDMFDEHEPTGPARVTTLRLPKLQMQRDEIDGTISQQLSIELCWVDDDEDEVGPYRPSTGTPTPWNQDIMVQKDHAGDFIQPQRCGYAKLSIEQFQSEGITKKETVMKVLRQTWEYKEENVIYTFTFAVPFKVMYISWDICDGDELDFTQSMFEVSIRYDVPEDTEPEATIDPSVSIIESDCAAIPLKSSPISGDATKMTTEKDDDVNTLDDHSMPNAVYVRTVSGDDTLLSSTAGRSSQLILPRKNRGSIDPDRDENDTLSELLSVASCMNSSIALPSITYVKVEKKKHDEEVGLSLIEKNGATIVAEVSRSGLFANSKLKEGSELLAINGHCVRGPRSVMRITKDLVGKVVIMLTDSPSPPGCRFVVKRHNYTGFGTASKLAEDITLESVNSLVRVKGIKEDGVFQGSPICKGDICLSVDGVPTVNEGVAARALGRSNSMVALLIFSLSDFWKGMVEFSIDEKYNRWWKKDNLCKLLWGNEDCAPITLKFDESTGLCSASGNEEKDVDLRYINITAERIMKLLTNSIQEYQATSINKKRRDSSRSLSVSPSGKMKNRSDVYRRALIKLDEMREAGMSQEEYEAGRQALAQVAISNAS